MYKLIRLIRFDLFVSSLLVAMSCVSLLLYLHLFISTDWNLDLPALGIANLISVLVFSGFISFFSLMSRHHRYPYQKLNEIMQIVSLFIQAGISILDEFDNSFGLAMILLGTLLLIKYRYINPAIIILLCCYTVTISVAGAYMDQRLHSVFGSIAFYIFFILVMGYSYLDSLQRVHDRNKILQDVIQGLNEDLMNKDKISSKLTAVRLDVADFSFTPAEKELLRLMCLQGITSNRDIADHLNKSVSTVKTQLYSIFEKTGVHKRSQLIAQFKESDL